MENKAFVKRSSGEERISFGNASQPSKMRFSMRVENPKSIENELLNPSDDVFANAEVDDDDNTNVANDEGVEAFT